MARAPLLQLSGISLTFGGNPVFDNLDLVVQPGDRVALVGRNGSGKSTLMKVMAGLVEPDRGTRVVPPGVTVGYMEQDPDLSGFETLGDYAASALPEGEGYRVDVVAEGLKFRPDTPVATASGGERRRAALAKLLAEAPELMLLDEPTNHLDIQAIEWLEAELRDTRAAFVLISHDRAFLRALTRATLWIDRGVVRRRESGFDGFEEWRETVWAEEDEARHKLDRKIKHEAKWAVEGISARRKRNMGRVRALQALRAERSSQIRRQGTAALELESTTTSGKKVIEAVGISKTYGDKTLIKNFDIRILRGDRVAFVGPNGVGKTTLLKMLVGEVAPDAGEVTLVGDEPWAPYDRPPLSKQFQLDGDESQVWLAPELPSKVKQLRPRKALAIDPQRQELRLDDGSTLPWDRLVLATGTRPRRLAHLDNLPRVLTLRTLDDAHAIREALKSVASLLVIGGGPIGLELAASAAALGRQSTLVEMSPRLMGRSAPAAIADILLE